MEVPEESFHWSSWDSWTCYPRRAFIQGLTDDELADIFLFLFHITHLLSPLHRISYVSSIIGWLLHWFCQPVSLEEGRNKKRKRTKSIFSLVWIGHVFSWVLPLVLGLDAWVFFPPLQTICLQEIPFLMTGGYKLMRSYAWTLTACLHFSFLILIILWQQPSNEDSNRMTAGG